MRKDVIILVIEIALLVGIFAAKAVQNYDASVQSSGSISTEGLFISQSGGLGTWSTSMPIQWGSLLQGSINNQVFFLFNNSTATLTLSLVTTPTSPLEGAYTLNVTSIGSDAVIGATLTLTASPTYEGSFSTTVEIVGT